jgi:hypothetical protein
LREHHAEVDSDSDSDSGSDSSDSSSKSSHFGLDGSDAEKPKKKAKKPPTKPAAASSAASGSSTGRQGAPTLTPTAEHSNLRSQAAAAVKQCVLVTAASLWKGTLKPKDIETRLTKAVALAAEMEGMKLQSADLFLEDDEELCEQLQAHSSRITKIKELMALVRKNTVKKDVLDGTITSDFRDCVQYFDLTTLSDILTLIGSKLLEAGRMTDGLTWRSACSPTLNLQMIILCFVTGRWFANTCWVSHEF